MVARTESGDPVVVIYLYVALPLLCWAVMARTRTVGVPVGLALLAGTVALEGHALGWWTFRGAPEFYLEYVILAGLVVLGGRYAERDLLGGPRPAPRPLRVSVANVLFGIQLGAVAALTPFAALVMFHSASGVPRAAPAVPAGFTLTREHEESCGSTVCSLFWEVHSTAGLPPEETARILKASAEPCRPNGYLLDRRDRCVSVSHRDDRVWLVVSLSES
ncbi:hypothetical protein ACWCYY_04460 [Kitasatospora sp. NPDC001664]|uniref:hypothetical protein n=1 Tax=Kitasatospora albolonga TaxID=68173 RepID=UPI0035E80B24